MRALEDLSTFPPKKLVRRLEELADGALPCLGVNAYAASPGDGLTVGLSVDSRKRRDVLDLVRVVESEPGGWAVVAWATITPSRKRPAWTLLLRVEFERPVRCAFAVRFDVQPHPNEPAIQALPLLLAANAFAISFDAPADGVAPVVLVAAPVIRDAILSVLLDG
jgi:hypothetical protein